MKVFSLAVFLFAGSVSAAIFVSPDGIPSAQGTAWHDAKDLTSALASALPGDELWLKSGTYTTNGSFSVTGVVIPEGVSLKGGFTGASDTSDERFEGALSVLEGDHAVTNLVTITATNGTVSLENIVLQHGFHRGLYAAEKAANMSLVNCRIHENGLKKFLGHSGVLHGRGVYLVGASAATLTISNCVVSGNLSGFAHTGGYTTENGCGAYIKSYKSLTICDTHFLTNGLAASKNGRASSLGGALYLEKTPFEIRRTRFVGNSGTGHTYDMGGVLYICGDCGDSSLIENCLFLGNYNNAFNIPSEKGPTKGMLDINLSSIDKTVSFRNCTFAFNRYVGTDGAAGISVSKGTARIENSIFWGNFASIGESVSADIRVRSNTGAVYMGNSLIRENSSDYVSAAIGATLEMTDMVYADPLFVTPDETVLAMANKTVELPLLGQENGFAWTNDLLSVDVHVKSSGGRWNGSAWVEDDVVSPAVDAGVGDVRDEPSPNGNLVNIGYYGGTPTASKTPAPEVSLGDISVVEDDWTRPGFAVTMGGGEFYRVAVYLCYGAASGSADGTNGWSEVVLAKSAAQPGDTVSVYAKEYFDKGDEVHYNIVVMSGGDVLAVKGGSAILTAEPPPFRGHGGGENIIHVRDGAWAGDGRDWENAFSSLSQALAAVDDTRNEIWVMGDVAMDCDDTITRDFKIRGGFTGLEDTAEERTEGRLSVIDATGRDQLRVNASSGNIHLEDIEITRAKKHALYVTGGVSLSMNRVRIINNGTDAGIPLEGRGVYMSGSSSTTVLAMTNCLVAGNRTYDSSSVYSGSSKGVGAYISGLKRVYMTDSVFASNGCQRMTAPWRGSFDGGCMYVYNAPIMAVNSRFIGNCTCVHSSGAAISLLGTGGHIFSNCLFAANSMNRWETKSNCSSAGTIHAQLANKDATMTFRNCTFAYNIADGTASCAGLSLMIGTARFTDCIFWGNSSNANYQKRAQNIALRESRATVIMDHCLMEGPGEPYVYCHSTTTNLTMTNMIYADPRFVSTKDDFAAVTTPANSKAIGNVFDGTYFTSDEALGSFNLHLRSRAGYVDENTGEIVRYSGRSPAIDAGSGDALLEPMPNGKRRNLGFYGGTPWATMSTPRGFSLMLK